MSNCELCGMPMQAGEEMFKYHGHSGPCPAPHKPAHQARVVEEKRELDEKISKLVKFLESDISKKLDTAEVTRLERQLGIMGQYSDVLGERIANF